MSLTINKTIEPKSISFKKVASVGLKMGEGLTYTFSQLVSSASSFHKTLTPFVQGAAKANRVMSGLNGAGLIYTPFLAISTGEAIVQAAMAPGLLKVYPSLKVISNSGSLLESFVSLVGVIEHLAETTLPNSAAIVAPLGAAALILQAAGLGVTAWQLHELNKEWEGVEERLGKLHDPTHESTVEEYEAAVHFLTNEPKTKFEKYKRLFFGFISDSQRKKVAEIFNHFKSEPDLKTVKTTFDELKKRHIQQKIQHAITIALLIIGAVGVLLLLFLPTPVAPVAWGILAGTAVASLGMIGYNFFASRAFNHYLAEQAKKMQELAKKT